MIAWTILHNIRMLQPNQLGEIQIEMFSRLRMATWLMVIKQIVEIVSLLNNTLHLPLKLIPCICHPDLGTLNGVQSGNFNNFTNQSVGQLPMVDSDTLS